MHKFFKILVLTVVAWVYLRPVLYGQSYKIGPPNAPHTFRGAALNLASAQGTDKIPSATAVYNYANGWFAAKAIFGTPTNGQVPTFDQPNNRWIFSTPSGGGGGGTVTSFSAGNLTNFFTSSVANATSTPALSFSFADAAPFKIWGRASGTGAPSYLTLESGHIPDLDAAKITAGIFGTARIPDLDAAKITSGVFDVARIPDLNASKITAGTLPIVRGGTGLSTLGTAGQLPRVNAGATELEYFTPSYLTGNQTITLSGDLSGTGETTIAAAIASNAVTSAKIADNAVGNSELADNAVNTAEIADNSVTSAKILDGQVGENDIAALAVTQFKIGVGAVATDRIADNAVTSAKIPDGAVGASELASTAVTAGTYGSGTQVAQFTVDADGRITGASNVNVSSGGTGTVTSFSAGNFAPLFNASVANSTTTPALTFSAISQLQNLVFASPDGASGIPGLRALAAADIPNLDAGKINSGTFGSARIADNAITNAKIGDGQINAVKISSNSLTANEIANNAVGTSELATGAVTTLKIAADAVTSTEIAASAVGASELASTAVTAGTYGSATQVPQFTVDADGRITAASNVTITGGSGTVTSFSAGNLSPLFTTSVANSTTTPALTFSQVSQSPKQVFMAPNIGSGVPTFRDFVPSDINQAGATNGQVIKWNGTNWAPAADATGGGGGALEVQDEGSPITAAAVSLNFVGPNVAATQTSDFVTVTISPERTKVKITSNQTINKVASTYLPISGLEVTLTTGWWHITCSIPHEGQISGSTETTVGAGWASNFTGTSTNATGFIQHHVNAATTVGQRTPPSGSSVDFITPVVTAAHPSGFVVLYDLTFQVTSPGDWKPTVQVENGTNFQQLIKAGATIIAEKI